MDDLKHKNVFIIGLGLIGGSIAYDLSASKSVAKVIGYDSKNSIMTAALKKKAVNRTVRSIKDGIEQADIIILATPIRTSIKLAPQICRMVNRSQTVMDVVGTKKELLKAIEPFQNKVNYISGHPLAGTEKIGFAGAQKHLFKQHTFMLTPLKGSLNGSKKVVQNLVVSLGADPIFIEPDLHDRFMALTICLPYMFSLGLTNMAIDYAKENNSLRHMIGGSYKAVSRVASSSPELTLDMFLTNRDQASEAIDGIIAEFNNLKRLLKSKDEAKLKELIKRARRKNEAI